MNKDAERTLKGMGRTIKQNTPGPQELGDAFHYYRYFWLFYAILAFLLLIVAPV